MDVFDPYQLIPLATINQRKIIALPGIRAAWVGRIGFDLIGKHALIQAVQAQAGALGLEGADPADLPFLLNQCLESNQDQVRSTAEAIAQNYGCGLGALIASILSAPEGLTDPMDPWEQGYLNYWRTQVKHILLGGGLANGRLGHTLAAAAAALMEQAGLTGIRLSASAYPSYLTLIGAARRAPPDCRGKVIVFDFGHTWVKRGIAVYTDDHALVGIHALAPISSGKLAGAEKASELAGEMIAILCDTYRAARQKAEIAPLVVCCLAAYVRAGQPILLNRGSYAQLANLSPNFSAWLSDQLSNRLGQGVSILLAHDCEAAAWAYAGQPRTATIMLGTASGVGFAPPAALFRPLSSHFALQAE